MWSNSWETYQYIVQMSAAPAPLLSVNTARIILHGIALRHTLIHTPFASYSPPDVM